MIKYINILILVVFLVLFAECDKSDNPISNTVKPYPSGFPDWNNKEFDWIDTCYPPPFLDWRVYPKNSIILYACSPDGNALVVRNNGIVAFFSTNSHLFTGLFPGDINDADWTDNGKYVGMSLSSNDKSKNYCIYDWTKKNYRYISIPDSFDMSDGYFRWFNGDSIFLTALNLPKTRSYAYLVNINPPYQICRREDLSYTYEQYDNIRYDFTWKDYDNKGRGIINILELKDTNNIVIKQYAFSGLNDANFWKISPNGRYLAFYAGADITNSKRKQEGVLGLGVIDLQNLNGDNSILYRFFPDYMNCIHNKSFSLYYSNTSGTWSSDSKYFYHSYFREDSTVKIVKRNIYTGAIEFLTDIKIP